MQSCSNNDFSVTLTNIGDKKMLVFKNPRAQDEGTYTCKGRFQSSVSLESRVNVVIYGMFTPTPFIFVFFLCFTYFLPKFLTQYWVYSSLIIPCILPFIPSFFGWNCPWNRNVICFPLILMTPQFSLLYLRMKDRLQTRAYGFRVESLQRKRKKWRKIDTESNRLLLL